MPEISFDQPVVGKKIVAAINSVCKQLGGIDFVYTPHQIRYKEGRGETQWFYDHLSLVLSSISMRIRADGLERMEAEGEYSTLTFLPDDEGSDPRLFAEVFEKFETILQSEVKKPLSDIAPSPKVAPKTEKMELPELSEEDKKRIADGVIRILAVVQGEYGERIAKHIAENGPDKWEVNMITLETDLPQMIDDPEEYLPSDLPKADLLLAMQEDSSAAQLIVYIARIAGVRGVIAPIDNSEWLPEGMKNQLERELKEMGVETVFPRPFCVLEEIGSPLIDQFARCFGRPKLELKWENDKVTQVDVLVDAACGSAKFVAKELIGKSIDDAVEKAGLAHHHYPCLASMKVEKDLEDTLMHVSGLQIKKAVDKILAPERKKKAVYIDPDTL